MMEKRYRELKAAEKGAIISIVSYLILSVAKLVMGKWGNSAALFADGLNNFTDILASIAVLIGLRLAQRPADDDHRYGHWKVETVASMVTSFIMLTVGLQVLYSSIQNFVHHRTTTPDFLVAGVSFAAGIVMLAVYYYNKNLAKRLKSQALLAAAKDNLSDAYTSFGTAIAILAASFHLGWLDSLTAFIIGCIIVKTAIGIFQESAFSLSDGFSEEQLEEYRVAMMKIEGIREVRTMRGRHYGSNVFLDVTVLMDPLLTVRESHRLTEVVEQLMHEEYHVMDVDVHVEPYEKNAQNGGTLLD